MFNLYSVLRPRNASRTFLLIMYWSTFDLLLSCHVSLGVQKVVPIRPWIGSMRWAHNWCNRLGLVRGLGSPRPSRQFTLACKRRFRWELATCAVPFRGNESVVCMLQVANFGCFTLVESLFLSSLSERFST